MKVKLLSVWIGPKPLPKWVHLLRRRMGMYRWLQWELITPSLETVNWTARQVSGFKVRKEDGYATYDLRPLYRHMFGFWYGEVDWWGWMDLDVLTGDLDRLLPPLLENNDIVTTDANYIHGPLTLLRNNAGVNNLWRLDPRIESVLTNPAYTNYDETGFGINGPHPSNPSFTQLVRDTGLKVHYDDRCWTQTQDMVNGVPMRGCSLIGDRLIEHPTDRELLCYHFTKAPKRWPIPDPWASLRIKLMLERQPDKHRMPEPAESPDYWTERLVLTLSRRWDNHRMVLDAPTGDWKAIQEHTRGVLAELIKPGERVLDAGCSYGALLDVLPAGVEYTGVDYCPAMLHLARELYDAKFLLVDIRNLSSAVPRDSFDWVVCRGLEGTAKTLLSMADWEQMEREMLRAGKRLLLIDMSKNWRVVSA